MIGKLISSLLTFLLSFSPLPSLPTIRQTTVLFAGDVMLGRSVMSETLRLDDPFYPFRKVAGYTRDADITFVNLENPIIKNCPTTNSGFKFCTTPEIAQSLKNAGVDVVSLANNHSSNYGKEGLVETKKYLDEMGIFWTGGTKLAVIEKGPPGGEAGTKFGFLGFDYVYRNLSKNDLDLVKHADSQVDVLVVSPHWGDEYSAQANKFQQDVAKKFVESGADLIIGHHPHWVQNNEVVSSVPVYYSLGNFVFDQMWSEETKKGMLVKFSFVDGKVVKKEEYRTYIPKIGQPEIIINP